MKRYFVRPVMALLCDSRTARIFPARHRSVMPAKIHTAVFPAALPRENTIFPKNTAGRAVKTGTGTADINRAAAFIRKPRDANRAKKLLSRKMWTAAAINITARHTVVRGTTLAARPREKVSFP